MYRDYGKILVNMAIFFGGICLGAGALVGWLIWG
jgi:hypothetical protein